MPAEIRPCGSNNHIQDGDRKCWTYDELSGSTETRPVHKQAARCYRTGGSLQLQLQSERMGEFVTTLGIVPRRAIKKSMLSVRLAC